ncbi:MAG: mandelate racemase [Gammaproteobacteria bacterium]|nr:mandelate racemase [Gammaproteobacteria bacterium]
MLEADLYHIQLPMRRKFEHARAQRKTAEGLLLRLRYNDVVGIGECVPREYVTGETINSVSKVLSELDLRQLFAELDFSSAERVLQSLVGMNLMQLIAAPNAVCILELALLDLIGKTFSYSLADLTRYLAKLVGVRISSDNKYYPTCQVMDFGLAPNAFLEQYTPFHFIKIKVGLDVEENIERVSVVRESVGPDVPISVDANMAWDLQMAREMVNALQKFNISYFEEPLLQGDYLAYQKLRVMSNVRILLDESVYSLAQAQEALKYSACNAINVRISKCGGLIASMQILRFMQANNLGIYLGAQAAELGPLIAAARGLLSVIDCPIAFEAGQPDRLFNDSYVVDPMPLVDRATNLATLHDGFGLGVGLSVDFKAYVCRSTKLKLR